MRKLLFLSLLIGIVLPACAVSGTQEPGQSDSAGKTDKAGEAPAGGTERSYPELVDITPSTGISFEHLSSPEQKYIVESMSGGVALIDYDRDGWPDIYFTNAQSVEMALNGKKARSALYHNNHDGTLDRKSTRLNSSHL